MSWADYHRQRMSPPDAMARVSPALGEPVVATPAAVMESTLRARNERIRGLETKVQGLEDENLLLREALGMTWKSPREWKLTPMEAKFVGILMRVEIATRERLMTALYAHTDHPPDDKIINVMANHIRPKLRPFGLAVRGRQRIGYYLAEIDKAA